MAHICFPKPTPPDELATLDWPPAIPDGADAGCVSAGDAALDTAIRCYAAGLMSDRQIAARIADAGLAVRSGRFVGISEEPACMPPWCCIAEIAAACADCGLDFDAIADILGALSASVPAWPSDPAELAAFIRNAISEAQS